MKNEKQNKNVDIDILGSIEFDLTEAIRDLIYSIKSLKKDVDEIKNKNNI